MPWTYADWANADWSAAAILNEFKHAIWERDHAVQGGTPAGSLPWVSVGDDVQAAAFFSTMQAWIEQAYSSFVVSHDAGVERAAGYYDNAATIDMYPNLAAVFSAAGIAHANWRRYTTHPDDGGVPAWGQTQPGDIIGPWLFEDIQQTLNALKWTYSHRQIDATGTSNEKRAVVFGHPTEAAAKAAMAAAWGGTAPTTVGNYSTAVSKTYTTGLWSAIAIRRFCYLEFDRLTWTPPCAREVDFYYRAGDHSWAGDLDCDLNEFDVNGDIAAGYVMERPAFVGASAASNADPIPCLLPFGDVLLSQPNWSGGGGPVARGYSYLGGWSGGMQVVERWTGFSYQ